MRGFAFVLTVIGSCLTIEQLLSSEEWAFRLIKREFPEATPERKLVYSSLISAIERRQRWLERYSEGRR